VIELKARLTRVLSNVEPPLTTASFPTVKTLEGFDFRS